MPYLGGGFGSKSYTKMEPLTAAIARKAGRPVRIVNAVDESMITTRRHGMRCWMRTAAAADGTLLGREGEAWLDTGAYADNGPRVTATAGDAAPGPYRWQAVDVRGALRLHQHPPSAPTARSAPPTCSGSASRSSTRWPAALAWTALEIRRRNLVLPRRGGPPRRSGKPLDADLVGDVEKAAAAIGWGAAPARPCGTARRAAASRRPARGRGAPRLHGATVRMGPDGSVTC